jgi:hypothetical protein|tara:strand:+ start:544 stop:939 length:396 start_codon:yes stop_codon:yes gene_type:complete
MGAKYTDYIGIEIKQGLEKCIEKPQFEHHYFKTPDYPIIEKVGKVNYGESNYGSGPLTKTIFVEDAFGSHYKVSIEDLKHIKGHGWITHKEANKIDHHYDKEESTYIVDTPEYTKWLAESNAKWASKRIAS